MVAASVSSSVEICEGMLEAAKALYHVFSGEPAPAGANLEQLPSSETIAIESKIDDDFEMMIEPLLQIDLPGVRKVKCGLTLPAGGGPLNQTSRGPCRFSLCELRANQFEAMVRSC